MQSKPEASIPLRDSLTFRLTGGLIIVLLLIGIPFLLAFHRLLRNQQLATLEEATRGTSQVAINALRSTMLAGKPHLFDETIRKLAKEPGIERVLLLDHRGEVRISSDPGFDGHVFDKEQDATCRRCHAGPDSPNQSGTLVATEGGGQIFRALSLIRNEPECHTCHDPARLNNGILLMDLELGSVDRRFLTGIGGTVLLGSVMVVVTIWVLALLLRRMVHRPLQAVMHTGRQIVEGNLDARVPIAANGEFAQLASQVNSMTDHLGQSLNTVETQRRQLQSILDSVDDEIVVLDRNLRIVVANQAFRNECGAGGEELAERSCGDVSDFDWPCSMEQGDSCPVRHVFETGLLHKGITSRCETDGRERTIEVHASPLLGPDGTVVQVVEVRRDISERRKMEATLAHSDRLASLGLLAAGISHEINNPLGAIAASVEGLQRRMNQSLEASDEIPTTTAKTLERIGNEVRRGKEITDRLLKVARPTGGSKTLLDINSFVQEILAILTHQMEKAAVETQTELAPDLPTLCGDESRLGQVLMNLALNAIQAMEEQGGQLRVTTSTVNGMICISIEDTGSGILPEHLPKIYEPFFTTKPAGKGTGLGLFITHQIVTEMGGAIEVRSQPGRGTSFVVQVPTGLKRQEP